MPHPSAFFAEGWQGSEGMTTETAPAFAKNFERLGHPPVEATIDCSKVTGDLTINATTQEVVLDVEGPSASVRDSRGNEKIGLAASTQISRKKFGIIWNEAMESGGVAVADEVSVSLDLELIKGTNTAVTP